MSTAIRPAAVLWDMDGTLVDTEHYWFEAQTELVAEHGNGTWSDDDNTNLVGTDLRFAARYIQEHGDVRMPVDDIVNRLSEQVAAKCEQAVPWRPGARRLLSALHKEGIPCALVTMSWRRLALSIVHELPDGWFSVVVTGDAVEHGKPHPEPYLTAAAKLGVDPRDCVAIEDSPAGVESAMAAGCHTIAVPAMVAIEPRPGLRILNSLLGLTTADLLESRPPHHGVRELLKRRAALPVAGMVLLAAMGIGLATRSGRDGEPPPPIDIPLEAWAPYWAMEDATAAIHEHGRWLRRVSPFWFSTTGVDTVSTQSGVAPDEAAALIKIARARKAAIIPTVTDGTGRDDMAAILADPAQRTLHVDALTRFVRDNKFDGIDIDYENFAFVDDRSTWEATKPNWVAFIAELSGRMRDIDKLLTVSVPPVGAYWVYDYTGIEPHVDSIRIMAYDYSVGDPGPIAPLDYVRTVIRDAKAATLDDNKLVLGVALYGRNWPITTSGTCPAGDGDTTTVSQRSLGDLLARRGATPQRDAVLGETTFTYDVEFSGGGTSCRQTRQVFLVDEEGTRERIDLARTERLGGVSLWALGFDGPGTWDAIRSLARDQSTPATTQPG